MSQILKKLNAAQSSVSTEAIPPTLKLVENSPLLPNKKSTSPSRLKWILGAGFVLIATLVGVGRYLKYKAETSVASTTATTSLASETQKKPKLEGDAGIYQEASDHFSAKEYSQALDQFTFLLQKTPEDTGLLNNVGLCYLKLNDLTKAEFHFQEAIKRDPKDAATYNNLGSLRIVQRNWEEANSFFYQAILYRPELTEAHLNLAKTFELAGRPMEAVPEYQYVLTHADPKITPEIKGLIEKRITNLNSLAKPVFRVPKK